MKKFSFGKTALMVFMILAAGAVLAMPASAGSNTEQRGSYDVTSSAYWISSSSDQFQALGSAEEVNGDYASLSMTLSVSNTRLSFGPFSNTAYSWAISSGTQTYQDTQYQRDHVITTALTSSLGSSGNVKYTLSA